MKRLSLIGLISLSLLGCTQGYDQYVGYWKHDLEDNRTVLIAQIKKQDKDTYIFQNNVLYTKYSPQKDIHKEQVLRVTKDGLTLDGALGSSVFRISKDGDELRLSDRTYTRVKEDFYKTSLKHLEDCQALSRQFKKTLSKRPIYGSDAEKKAYDIKYQEFKVKEANIPDCNVIR